MQNGSMPEVLNAQSNQITNNQGNCMYNPWSDPRFIEMYNKAQINIGEHNANKAMDDFYKRKSREEDLIYQDELMKKKEAHAEKLQESSLARCEVAEIDKNGEIHIKTENLTIESSPRRGTNFRCVDTKIYVNAANPHEKIMRLSLKLTTGTIGTEETEVFLDLRKCEKGGYIDKKLEAAGAVIYAKSESKKKEYARMIIACLVQNCTHTITAPKNRGWYRVTDELKFYESEYTWKAVVEYAK